MFFANTVSTQVCYKKCIDTVFPEVKKEYKSVCVPIAFKLWLISSISPLNRSNSAGSASSPLVPCGPAYPIYYIKVPIYYIPLKFVNIYDNMSMKLS